MTICHMHIACWAPKAADTNSQYVMFFHSNNDCKNTPPCYVIRTRLHSLMLNLSVYILTI